ncbi:MAG TPA: hypothetical protein PKZ99_07830, partial [Azospirillaceae bacterium]|nr:hypothetical protein [Azospirillaceae bacterium]
MPNLLGTGRLGRLSVAAAGALTALEERAVQNPDARRRAIVAALIAIGVIAVLAFAIQSRGGDDAP